MKLHIRFELPCRANFCAF